MEREVIIGGGEACDEVILEGSNGSFGGVAAMDVWWHKLEIDVFFVEEAFQRGGGFIVKLVELWTEASGD